jgi:uncharacterized phosphosugar-binding protein
MIQSTILGNKLFDNYSMANAGNFNSSVIEIKTITGYAVHVIWSGASATDANFLLQASNDGLNWVTIDTTIINAASGQKLINIERAMYSYVRARFVKNSETSGTLSAILSGKVA